MISKLKWNNHYLLKNLELDFTKADGSIYDTIVLAGENGTGKTSILDTLAGFLDCRSIEPFECLEYSVEGGRYRIVPETFNTNTGFHLRKDLSDIEEEPERIHTGRFGDFERIAYDTKDLRHYGFAYSRAKSGFTTSVVSSTTTQQIDQGKYESDEEDDYTVIKQLLIDIENQDANEWKILSEEGNLSDQKYAAFKSRSKSFRFKNAFNTFFDNIEYKGVDDNDPVQKLVVFEKHGAHVPIDKLSTGEKQIVFRGAHLLKNTNSISGGIVLIDEPELSMHPLWQKKILNYYRGLFSAGGMQTVQMIIATHSEYVIRSALEKSDNVLVIVLSDNNGCIDRTRITAPGVLPSITAAETNYMAFKAPSIDYHIELYGYLQNKENKTTVKDCDNFIEASSFYDAAKHSKTYTYGSTSYQTLPTYIRNAIDHPSPGITFTEDELRCSIELLIELCK